MHRATLYGENNVRCEKAAFVMAMKNKNIKEESKRIKAQITQTVILQYKASHLILKVSG